MVENKNFKFATDPWALGPAFGTGWWLTNNTQKNWINELNSCNFIYLSHNHPDHMHALTLSFIRKDMCFLIPNFQNKSVEKCLKEMGFKNIFCADFINQYNFIGSELNLMVLKSGDFRDDSGLYFCASGTSLLFGVDSNNLNSLNLPHVDIYASSFAAGASGYPLIFDNYNLSEKKKILVQNKNLLKSIRIKEIKLSNAKYFIPYAGNFDEKLFRDKFIKKYNKKNKVEDFETSIDSSKTKLLSTKKFNEFYFLNGNLQKYNFVEKSKFKDLKPKNYISQYKKTFKKIDLNFIKNYFLKSNFKDKLNLYMSLTDDNFRNSEINFLVSFNKKKIIVKFLKKQTSKKDILSCYKKNNINTLFIKARIDSFIDLVINKNPWEDLSIGFQCRIFRIPNEYNANFWYHFSNIYIKSDKVRQPNKCNNCEVLNQNIHKELLLHGIS